VCGEAVNRRSFLRTMVGGVAVGAAVRTFPFRVFSFPSAPVLGYHFDRVLVDDCEFGLVTVNNLHATLPQLLKPGLRHLFAEFMEKYPPGIISTRWEA
jgi:hypothetical protein